MKHLPVRGNCKNHLNGFAVTSAKFHLEQYSVHPFPSLALVDVRSGNINDDSISV